MASLTERMSQTEVKIEIHDKEIDTLRDKSHTQGIMLHSHDYIVKGIEGSVKDLTETVIEVKGMLNRTIWMCSGAGIAGMCIYNIIKDFFL